jgi:predicted nucleic acid-binding protein
VANEAFFDTNILIYLLAGDPEKAQRARDILKDGGVISVQVLNEFVAVARRKHALTWDEINEWLTGYRRRFQVESLTIALQERAVEIAEACRLNIYDATIISSAEEAGCVTLFSEDMQHGQRIGALTIRNPFVEA